MKLRRFKKDIEYLVGSVVDDCTIYMTMSPNGQNEAANKIVTDAIDLYNELIDKANNPDKSSPGKIREHYRNIRQELYSGVDALFDRLNALAIEDKKQ